MASSSHVSNPNTETATTTRNDQPISTRSKDKGVFTQKSHLKEILEKVRDLSASCTLYEETWTDDQENKALIRLIGKILSVIPEEGQNESQPVQAEDRPPQVVQRNIKREEESPFLSVPDIQQRWLHHDAIGGLSFAIPWQFPYGATEVLHLPFTDVPSYIFNAPEAQGVLGAIDYAGDEPATVQAQVSNNAGHTSQTPGANEIRPSTRKRSRDHGHGEAESSQSSPKKRRASDALSDSFTTPSSYNSD